MFKVVKFCVLIIYCFNLCQCEDTAWNHLNNENREELVVTNVTAERLFPLQTSITKWKTLIIGPTCYSVGLSEKGLQILVTVLNHNKTGFYIKDIFHTTEDQPSDSVLIHNRKVFNILDTLLATGDQPSDSLLIHNRNKGTSEAVLVVSFTNQKKISWFRINNQNIVREFWSWATLNPVKHLNFFKIGVRQVLFFVTNVNVAFLYEIDIKNNALNKWLTQEIVLGYSTCSSAFNTFRGQHFLSITQRDSISIYKFSKNKFQNFTKIPALHVTTLVNFDIGFKTFLAINGLNAGIYEFSSNGLLKQEVSNTNLEGVTFWLPIPVQTYRDEVLLFAQRALDHSTHKTLEVDIITYNNVKFEEHEDVNCTLFKETTNWLACLTHENGIQDGTFLVIEDKVGLIVPRKNNSFILFMIHTEMRQKSNPQEQEIQRILENKKKIELLIEQQNKIYQEITKLLNPEAENVVVQKETVGQQQNIKNVTSYIAEVDKIGLEVDKLFAKVKTLENLERQSKFRNIIINGDAKFEGIAEINEIKVKSIDQEPATMLLQDIVNKDNIIRQLKQKTFSDLEVENLEAKTVNGIDANNMVFLDEPEIVFNGNVTFMDFAAVENVYVTTKKINDIIFPDEAVILGHKHEGTLDFKNLKVEDDLLAFKINNINIGAIKDLKNSKVKRNLSDDLDDTIFIMKNLTVTFINGENFTEFLHSLCMINSSCYIPGNITIREKIQVDDINTDFLNGLKFSDYIMQNNETSENIIGKKIFKNSLMADDIITQNNINGVDTQNLVTLSTNQNLKNLTFKLLELTEKLDVDGKILGEKVDIFLKNPTLPEVNHLRSNVNFKDLEVKGKIILENNLNGQNFKSLLKNLVYDDEKQAAITSLKEFTKNGITAKNLNIISNSINTVPLEKFVTKSTDQILDINLLNGNVIIKNLHVNGKYDGKNITEVDESLVKLSGDQFISSILSFHDLEVENLEITGKLNDKAPEEILLKEKNKNLDFDKLVINNLIVEGNIEGEISGYDLKNINEKYLSLTKNQDIESFFNINTSSIDHLKFVKINNISNDDNIFDETRYIEELLNNDHLKIENLHVEESINANKVNDEPVSSILPVSLLDIVEKNGNKLIIQNELLLKEIEIENFGSNNWNDYVKQIVFKNETNSTITFTGPKSFLQGITVEALIETKQINNISVHNVLTKEGQQIVRGPIELVGDLSVVNVDVKEKINDIQVKDVLERLQVTENGNYHLKKNLVFQRLAYINSLKIEGKVNNKKIEDLFKELVYQNKSIVLENDVVFRNPVTFEGNLMISNNFNNIPFSDKISNIVLTTQDATIESLVTFSKDVNIEKEMTVDGDLTAKFVKGFDTRDWQEKAIYVNKGLLKGHYKFDSMEINDDLTTNFINDINMSRIIPLKSKQSIDFLQFRTLKFVNNIPVGNMVNGLYLPDEFQRTLMNDTDQDILPETIFNNNVLVRQNLRATFINNKNTSKIVTTNTDQNLTAKYHFYSKVKLESNLELNGLINDVNYEEWKKNTLRLSTNSTQHVKGQWNIFNLTFDEDVMGSMNLSGLDLQKVAKEIKDRKDLKYQFEHGIVKDYIGICDTLNELYEKAKSQIYKFKYLEEFQEMFFKNNIKYVFNFSFNKTNYIFINQENCLSDIMVYNGVEFIPLLIKVNTGILQQVVTVYGDETLYLVTRGHSLRDCNDVGGTNIWEFDGSQLIMKYIMEDQDLLQSSLVPSTFYAANKEGIVEYKITEAVGPVKYRSWKVFEDNIAFMPRGLKTGLAVRTGKKLVILDRTLPRAEDLDSNLVTESVIKGTYLEMSNDWIPGKNGGDITHLRVGTRSSRKNFLAVASHEDTVIPSPTDFVKIYENALTGKLFDKVPTYRPSSLISLEFNQGETILVFLEDQTVIKLYEYKGIGGFKLRSSIKIKKASSLFHMVVNDKNKQNDLKTIGIVFSDKIVLLQVVMDGTKIRDDLKCNL